MAEVGAAWVTVAPSMKGFGRTLERGVSGETASAGKSIGSKFGSAIKVGALAAVGGAALAGRFLKGAIEEAREAQVVTARTEGVIKSMGNVAGISAKQVADLAGAISAKTGIDDEAIQSGQNMLLTFGNVRNEVGKGNDIFNQASQTMVDYAAAMEVDAKGAAVTLGKALNDPIKGLTALGKAGVQFTEGQKAQITAMVESGNIMGAQKVILGELTKQFGGAAEQMATPADKARVAFDNLKEQIGTALLPALDSIQTTFTTKIAPAISTFVTQMQNGTGAGGRFADKVKALADRAREAGAFLVTHRATIVKLVAALVAAKAAIVAVKVAMAAYSAITVGVNAVVAAAAAVQGAYNAVLGLSRSYLATWIGVKALEAAAWLRSTASTVASTAAMVANRVVYGAAWLAAFVIVKAGELAAWVASTSATVAATVSLVAHKAATIAISAATKAAAAAQWVLNAALAANPIGLVVALIVALIAVFVLAYKKSETFRAIVDASFRGVAKVVGFVVDFIKTTWAKVTGFLSKPVSLALAAISGYWNLLQAGVRVVIDVVKAVWSKMRDILSGPFEVFSEVVSRVWEALKTGVRVAKSVVVGAFDAMKNTIQSVIDFVQKLIDKIQSIPGIPGGGDGAQGVTAPVTPRLPSPVSPRVLGQTSTGGASMADVVAELRALRAVAGIQGREFGQQINGAATNGHKNRRVA